LGTRFSQKWREYYFVSEAPKNLVLSITKRLIIVYKLKHKPLRFRYIYQTEARLIVDAI